MEITPTGGCGGHCTCGAGNESDDIVLDVRLIPHEVRKGSVLGAVGAVPAGGRLVLLAPHDPVPMLALVDRQYPGSFVAEYLDRGPEQWRVRLSRSG